MMDIWRTLASIHSKSRGIDLTGCPFCKRTPAVVVFGISPQACNALSIFRTYSGEQLRRPRLPDGVCPSTEKTDPLATHSHSFNLSTNRKDWRMAKQKFSVTK